MGSAFEKSVLVQQTVVSPRKTIALIVEIKVSIAGKMVSGTSTMVSGFEKMEKEGVHIFVLRTHAQHRIAPIAVAGGAADGAHLEHVGCSRGEAVDRHRARVGEDACGLPGTGSVPDADRQPHFVRLCMRNRCDFQHQFGAVPEADVENRGIRQRRFGACENVTGSARHK